MKKVWNWKNVDLSSDECDRLHQDFEVKIYRKALELDPENIDVLVSLGDTFAKRKMLQDGLEIDKRLVRICPNEPTFYYNLACSHSLLGQIDEAFGALERSIQLGYKNFDHLMKDSDLENLRRDIRFQRILKDHSR